MKFFIRLFLFSLLLIPTVAYNQTASLLPNAVQQFFDNNGNPLSVGTVDTYVAGTSTRKTTWKNSGETVTNTNPIILDAGGKAIIYGEGTYRQVVKDRNGNIIWDAVTTPASGGGGGGGGTATTLPVGWTTPFSGIVAPTLYQFAYGQELIRANFPDLFTAITITQNVGCTNTSTTITGLTDTTQIPIGSVVELNCVPPGTTVVSRTSSTIVLSNPANVSLSASATFFPYGNGNGSTTFNVVDLRGQVVAGRNNMGGTPTSRLTQPIVGADPNSTGASFGNQTNIIISSNLPPYTPTGTFSGTPGTPAGSVSISDTRTWSVSIPQSSVDGGTSSSTDRTGAGNTGANTLGVGVATGSISGSFTGSAYTPVGTFTGSAQGGTSVPFTIVQPTITLNYIIKVLPGPDAIITSGVDSIQGMTGVITCGTGLLCAGNDISNTVQGFSSIISFGAKCDGVTDDRAAFLAAFAANTPTLYIPNSSGACLASGQLELPTSLKYLYGPGTIKKTGPNVAFQAFLRAANPTDLTISEVYIDLNETTYGSNGAINIVSGTNVLIKNVTMPQAGRFGLQIETCTSCTFQGNIFSNYFQSAIEANACGACSFLDNRMTAPAGISGPAIINLNVSAGNDLIISRNYSYGGQLWGIHVGDTLRGQIINNNVQDTGAEGITVGASSTGTGTKYVIIENNDISWGGVVGADYGLSIQGDSGTRQVMYTKILGNRIVNSSNPCIAIAQDALYTTVEGNYLVNCNRSTGIGPEQNSAIILDGPRTRYSWIKNNVIWSDGTNITIGIKELVTDIDYTFVDNNTIFGQTGTDIVLTGTNSKILTNLKVDGTSLLGSGNALSENLDLLSVGRGAILTKGAATWFGLTTATVGLPLISGGSSADNSFAILGLSGGGTNANLSSTGGTSQVLKQVSTGATITVGRLACSDLSDAGAGCSGGSGTGAITSLTTDVVATGPGAAVATIQTAVVTYAKIQNIGALAIMGRSANSSGVGANISATAASDCVFRESGSTIGCGTIATAGIANNVVTLAKLATQATNTVLGNATSGTAVPTALAVGSCSTSSSALIWTTNTGFGCNTAIAASSATTATNATNIAITDDTATNAAMNLTWVTSNTGNLPQKTTSTKLNFNPSTGVLSSTSFTGAGTGLTGTAASLTSGTVTTNANLTGDITSSGNATTYNNAVPVGKLGGSAASHGSLIDVAGTATWKVIPDCQDVTGNHLNYTQSTDTYSCGTTNGPAPSTYTPTMACTGSGSLANITAVGQYQLTGTKQYIVSAKITADLSTCVGNVTMTLPITVSSTTGAGLIGGNQSNGAPVLSDIGSSNTSATLKGLFFPTGVSNPWTGNAQTVVVSGVMFSN